MAQRQCQRQAQLHSLPCGSAHRPEPRRPLSASAIVLGPGGRGTPSPPASRTRCAGWGPVGVMPGQAALQLRPHTCSRTHTFTHALTHGPEQGRPLGRLSGCCRVATRHCQSETGSPLRRHSLKLGTPGTSIGCSRRVCDRPDWSLIPGPAGELPEDRPPLEQG